MRDKIGFLRQKNGGFSPMFFPSWKLHLGFLRYDFVSSCRLQWYRTTLMAM